jgi:hypothetical protein
VAPHLPTTPRSSLQSKNSVRREPKEGRRRRGSSEWTSSLVPVDLFVHVRVAQVDLTARRYDLRVGPRRLNEVGGREKERKMRSLGRGSIFDCQDDSQSNAGRRSRMSRSEIQSVLECVSRGGPWLDPEGGWNCD